MNNRSRNTWLRGFTLIEIIIAMLLSGILLAVAVKIMLTIMSVSTLQNKTSSQNNNIILVYTLLKDSFMRSETIEVNENEDLIFNFPNKTSTSISFGPSIITISNLLSIDTIPVPWENLQVSKLDSVAPLIGELSFIISYNNSAYPVYIRKEYSNQVLYKYRIVDAD